VKPRKVACGECAKELPASAARTAEGKDYAMYFCGAGCERKWRQKQNK
jgi:hypothetical protein